MYYAFHHSFSPSTIKHPFLFVSHRNYSRCIMTFTTVFCVYLFDCSGLDWIGLIEPILLLLTIIPGVFGIGAVFGITFRWPRFSAYPPGNFCVVYSMSIRAYV